jgi:hypothetical protein
MIKPNLAVIGAARCGTSSLVRSLSRHPDIFISDPKEPHFYAHHGSVGEYCGPGDEYMINSSIVRDPNEFYGLFQMARDESFVGDGSVSTMFYPQNSIAMIRKFGQPDFKIVAILRKPSERAFSNFMYMRSRGHEHIESFSEALEVEAERKNRNFHHMWLYKEGSSYKSQLEPFVKEFGDNLLVIVQEEFRSNPENSLRDLLQFLPVPYVDGLSISRAINSGGEPRIKSVTKLMNFVRKNETLLHGAKKVCPRAVVEFVKSISVNKACLPRKLATNLNQHFAEDEAYVEYVLGRSIDTWRGTKK